MKSFVSNFRFFVLITTFVLMGFSAEASAWIDNTDWQSTQDVKKVSRMQAIRNQRDAFFVIELELSPEEAKKFLPLMNELYDKRYKLWKSIRQQRREVEAKGTMTDGEVEKLIDSSLQNSVDEAKLEKDYYDKFKKVLPLQKVAMIRPTERKYARVYHSY